MGISFWESKSGEIASFARSGVTRRSGGVSKEAFDSLNLGLHVGDEAECVCENRRRAAEARGFSFDDLVCAQQVHGGAVQRVGRAERGRGARDFADALPGVDALMTDEAGVLLMLLFADCVPVLFADPVRRVVAVAHAGWRGVVANVVENTLGAMASAYGTKPGDVRATIGPGIGPCCFVVGAEVAARFSNDAATRTDGSLVVDLAGALRRRLMAAGIPAGQIDVCRECTSCHTKSYFSYRREGGQTGRMGALIGIPAR